MRQRLIVSREGDPSGQARATPASRPARSAMSAVPHEPPFRWQLALGPGAARAPAVQPFVFRQEGETRIAEPVVLLIEGRRAALAAVERLMAGELPRLGERPSVPLTAMHRR